MKQQYAATWEIPATDGSRMISFGDRQHKEISDALQAKETGVTVPPEPLVYGTGTETQGMKMLLDMRMMVKEALRVEGGIVENGSEFSNQIAMGQYDFAKAVLSADGVRTANVEFTVTNAEIQDGDSPGSKVLKFTTKSAIRQIMQDGTVKTPITTDESYVISLDTPVVTSEPAVAAGV